MVKLRQNQEYTFNKCLKLRYSADLSDAGTGKTYVQLALADGRGTKTNLIICPPSLVGNVWCDSIEAYFGDNAVAHRLDVGSFKASQILRKEFPSIKQDSKKMHFFIIPYDTAKTIIHRTKKEKAEFSRKGTCAINDFYWDNIILDESTKIKGTTSNRGKKITSLRTCSKYRQIMTGTVAPNGYMDIFMQYLFLSDSIFGYSWYNFRETYFIKVDEFKWVPKTGTAAILKKKIAPFSVQHKKRDCVDLPPITHIYIKCPMSREQELQYNMMRDEAFVLARTEYGDDYPIPAAFANTVTMKLRQISSGFIYNDLGEILYMDKRFSKIEELIELVESIKDKVVVFYNFKGTLKLATKAFDNAKIPYVIHNSADTDACVKRFKEDAKVYIANPASAGHGLNLQFASYLIYIEKDFNLETYLQSIARIERIGQKNKMTVYHLESSNMCRYIDKRLSGKKDDLEAITIKKMMEEL